MRPRTKGSRPNGFRGYHLPDDQSTHQHHQGSTCTELKHYHLWGRRVIQYPSSARHLREDLNHLLKKPQMTICKWRTNSPELFDSIPEHLRETDDLEITSSPGVCPKALGLHWSTTHDTLHVATPPVDLDEVTTKKSVASTVARTFDAMGWFSPAILPARILIQEAWKLQLGWDIRLPEDMQLRWRVWTSQLSLITLHPIPRYYGVANKVILSQQLHGFADASTKGYGGVVYIRTFYSDATVNISLISSKARVVPLRKNPPTIPRLELCGALLLAQLLDAVTKDLSILRAAVYAWSDSSAVLGWINKEPSKLNTFVCNRVTKLTALIAPTQWRYVSTIFNPADCLSRGVLPQDLMTTTLWWQGPPWLSQDPAQWPRRPDINLNRELPEVKHTVLHLTPIPLELGTHISSFSKLVRVVAWVWKFYYAIKNKSRHLLPPVPSLSLLELLHAKISLLRHSQRTHFSTKCNLLERKTPLPRTHPLTSLVPFLDKNRLLRVGGRLQKAGLSPTQAHPLILSTKSNIVLLLIRHLHETLHHAGSSTMMAVLAQTYHIPQVKRLLRKLSHNCVTCQKIYAKTAEQFMGEPGPDPPGHSQM